MTTPLDSLSSQSKNLPQHESGRTTAVALSRRHEWAVIFLLAAVQFCHVLDFILMMPLGPAISRQLNISTTEFGILVSSYSFASAVMGFFAAFFLDKIERRRSLVILFGGFILATIACGLTSSFGLLLCARVLAGCFGGVVGASVYSIAGELIAPERRGMAMGVIMAAFSVASVAGIPIGLALAEHFFWNAPFLALGGLSFIIGLLIRVILPIMTSHLEKSSGPFRPAHALRSLRDVFLFAPHFQSFLLITLLMLSGFSIIPYLATYLVFNVGLKNSELSLMYICGGIGTVISSQIIGKLSDRMGHIKTLITVSVVSWIPLLLVTHSAKKELVPTLVMMTAFTMFLSGRIIPTMALVTTVSDPNHRGAFMSLFSAIQACAMGFASLLGGWILTENKDGTLSGFPLLGYFTIVMSIIAILVAHKMQQFLQPRVSNES